MHKRSPLMFLFALLAVAAIVAGCGGGGSSSDTSGSTSGSIENQSGEGESSEVAPDKAAFIKEADAICSTADEELSDEVEAYAKEHGIDVTSEDEPSDDQQEELYQEVVLPNIAKQGEELAALTPPKGDESTVEDLTNTLEDEVAEAEDEGGIPDEDALNGAVEKAQAYGLNFCGR